MMAITSPFCTLRSMPLSTSLVPSDLRRAVMSTMGGSLTTMPSWAGVGVAVVASAAVAMEFPFKRLRHQAYRKAQNKIQQGDTGVDEEGLVGGVGDHAARLGQLDKPNHRCQRRALDLLHQKTHRGRHRNAQRLGQHHMAQLLAKVE